MGRPEALIPKHGGYRRLKTFQLARLIYDVTVLFCDRFIDRRSRTHDQMVQAARSGVQNIAEGSQDSGTSKKFELKLTNVARASLEELRLDYEDFLRQRGLPQWAPDHPALLRFKARRCASLEDVRTWVQHEHGHPATTQGSVSVRARPCSSVADRSGPCSSVADRSGPCSSVADRSGPWASATLAANAALSLLNLCCYLLDRQLAAQAAAFQKNGGFTERLYRLRSTARAPGAPAAGPYRRPASAPDGSA